MFIRSVRAGMRMNGAFRHVTPSPMHFPAKAMMSNGVRFASSSSGSASSGGNLHKWGHRLKWATITGVIGFAGYIGFKAYSQGHPRDQLPYDPSLPTIVVAGNGWGTTSFLRNFDNTNFNVVVISPRNFFLFTPLLPSVTTGTLSSRSIIEPTRVITRRMKRECRILEGSVVEVDHKNKNIHVSYGNKEDVVPYLDDVIPYDYLIYGVGCENNTFNLPGVQDHAYFLKEIDDGRRIRRGISTMLEAAVATKDPVEKDRLLNFVIVGGGPTGVEYAAELRDYATQDLIKWYPELKDKIKISLIEATPKILPMFSQSLVDYTRKNFKENDIEILTSTNVQQVDDNYVYARKDNKEDVRIPYGLLVWAAGLKQREVTRKLMAQFPDEQKDRRGLSIDEYLRVLGADGSIFAIGDCTKTENAATAQVASQQGRYLASLFKHIGQQHLLQSVANNISGQAPSAEIQAIKALDTSRNRVRPFVYAHQGTLAYVGHERAIADLDVFGHELPMSGTFTYAFWRSVYFSQLESLRNQALVLSDWAWQKIFGRDISKTS